MADLDLSVRAGIVNGRLDVQYTVANQRSRDAYLLNRLFTTSGEPRMSPDIVYVELDEATSTARLFKGLFPLPPGMSGPPVPIAPYVTPVRAGSLFSEMMHLALPLRVYREYGRSPPPRPPREEHTATFRGITFAVSWYWRDPGVVEVEQTVYSQLVVVPSRFTTMPTIQTLDSGIVPIAVPVVLPTAP